MEKHHYMFCNKEENSVAMVVYTNEVTEINNRC